MESIAPSRRSPEPRTGPRIEPRAARRQRLQRYRTHTLLQGMWRTLATLGMASGLVWVTTLPDWTLVNEASITIVGNRLLREEALERALAWEGQLPASLLLLQPDRFVRHLKARAPIERVSISRSLLPVNLTLVVVERPPVAFTLPGRAEAPAHAGAMPTPVTQKGLLDPTGAWLPETAYTDALVPPALKIRGYSSPQRDRWVHLYEALRQSPLPADSVAEIDLRDPDNTILVVPGLGPVHIGASLPQLDAQLAVLAQLRMSLPKDKRAARTLYIDLRNPKAPAVRPRVEKG